MKLDVVLREDARSQISTTLRQPGKKDASPIHNDVLASGERRIGRTEPALAISSGVPMRPTRFCVAIVFFTSVSPSPKVVIRLKYEQNSILYFTITYLL
jgi:hypothetical protein